MIFLFRAGGGVKGEGGSGDTGDAGGGEDEGMC